MEMYADEYKDWKDAEVPCRAVTVDVDGMGGVTMMDGRDIKPPCSPFNEASGDGEGATIYLPFTDKRAARSFWPALKRAMVDDALQEVGLIDRKINELLDNIKVLRKQRREAKAEAVRRSKLKLK